MARQAINIAAGIVKIASPIIAPQVKIPKYFKAKRKIRNTA